MNNKLAEWRAILDKCVENYQSTRAWYEENRDSPAALDDMERAKDQLTKFVRKYGFCVVLDLLDEIDELQERRKADNEPVMHQTRTRPTWNASQPWSLWSECSAESYKEAMRFATEPDGAGWLYEGRILHTAPPVPEVANEHYAHLSELYHAQEKRLFKLAQRIKGQAFDKYSHSPSQAINVLEAAIFGENEDASRAAPKKD
ncbi:hypothetical protein INK77_003272 [Salmonella enterica subsp. enterica serovar Agbeni]|nr:hypothetical protein [Salmonella enterica subsp. enterica serovar Agbeni]